MRYSTGAPVRASDFVRGLEDAAQSSDIAAVYLDGLPGVEACPGARSCNLARAVTADDRAGTVTLHLTHPDPDILFALGLPYFAPKPPGRGIRPATGPYRIARYVPGVLIDYERNPFFHEWSAGAQPSGYPDRILVYSNGTATSDIAAVLDGRADYTFDTPTPSQLRTIQLQYPGLLHTQPLPDTDWLSMDTREAPFNDVGVRQALNDAVDRDAIAQLYGGLKDAAPTCQIIPATIPGHEPYCPYTHDLARARRLIATSGTRGETVTVLTESANGPGSEPVGAYMARLLRQLGYHARLHVVTQASQRRDQRLPRSRSDRDRGLDRGLPLRRAVDHRPLELRHVATTGTAQQPFPVLPPPDRSPRRTGHRASSQQPLRRRPPLGTGRPPDHQSRSVGTYRHRDRDRPGLTTRRRLSVRTNDRCAARPTLGALTIAGAQDHSRHH